MTAYHNSCALPDAGEAEQKAFDKFIVADGRHFDLFIKWKLGKLTEESFHRQELELLQELAGKFHRETHHAPK